MISKENHILKTLHLTTLAILVAIYVIVPQSVFAQHNTKEIFQGLVTAKKTDLSYNDTTLIVTQKIDKTEYKIGEKFSVTPYLQNIGSNITTITHGEPLFEIVVLDQNGNTSFIWGDTIATIGITESLEPGMSTTGRWTSGYGGFPEILLNKAGNYTIYSIASINSEGMPVHMESIWSKPLDITIFQANSTSQVNSTILEKNMTISRQPSHTQIIISPLKQFKSGISVKNITCDASLQLVLKSEDGSPACVTSNTAQKLIERGWAKEIVTPTSYDIIQSNTTQANSMIDLGSNTGIVNWKNQTYYFETPNYVNTTYVQPMPILFHGVIFTLYPSSFGGMSFSSCKGVYYLADAKFSDGTSEILDVFVGSPSCGYDYTPIKLSTHTNPKAGLVVYDGKMKLLTSVENK